MITIACVLRSGGGVYNTAYVEKLRDGVARNLKAPHRFVCLSDVDVPCERIALEHNWPGWWSKIELFKLPGPVLYFDLDTIITGDLGEIAACRDRFIILRNFYSKNHVGSGMMAWQDDVRRVYDRFDARVMGRCAGDQEFIGEMIQGVIWQDLLPGQIVSYKAHVRKAIKRTETGTGEIPEGARVVCFHGAPRPHETDLW